MASRREFLQVGLAATAMGSVTQVQGLPGGQLPDQSLPLYKVVYDLRYHDSIAFAKRMASQLQGSGESLLYGMRGDITPFWYQELDAVWRAQPVALAGMTAHGPLFCLERLAWELGMRVIWRSEHRHVEDRLMQHTLYGPEALVSRASTGAGSLVRNASPWCEQVADLLLDCRTGNTPLGKHMLTVPASAPAQQDTQIDAGTDPLIAWVIAPARRMTGV